MRLITDVLPSCKEIRGWITIQYQRLSHPQAGSTAGWQEWAFTFAMGIAYVEAALDVGGLDFKRVWYTTRFFFNVHNHFLETSLMPGGRVGLWPGLCVIASSYGPTAQDARAFIHSGANGGRTLTSQQRG